jgi:antitoxin VapB
MSVPVHTKTFMSGNSVAVRLPKGFAIPAGTDVQVEQSGDMVILRVTRDPAEEKRKLRDMLAALKALPKPPYVEVREPIEFPDRSGL